MKKRILYATGNPSKVNRMRDLLASFPVEVLDLGDVGIAAQAIEDGGTPAENALQKVEAAFPKCGFPTLAVDYGLDIRAFPEDKQPGMFVRRIHGKDGTATDEELLHSDNIWLI
jgi:XTP/dITP diphosphohydrolase